MVHEHVREADVVPLHIVRERVGPCPFAVGEDRSTADRPTAIKYIADDAGGYDIRYPAAKILNE